ncbi:MAG: response regulator [Thermoproteota archaeon]|nr:response regulator [Thermoproteota archaeon]
MNILIAEDEKDIALLYKKVLEARNHQVTVTTNGEDCLKSYHDVFQEMISSDTRSMQRQLPFDVVLLDYKMPQINGMEVAKEILAVNSHQRIIFASAHVKEILEDSIKQLKQVVELMQKPFTINKLIDTIEDKEVYNELQKLNVDIDIVRAFIPTHQQITDLLERLRKIQKNGNNAVSW